MIVRPSPLALLLLLGAGCANTPEQFPVSSETVLSSGGFSISAEPLFEVSGAVDSQPILVDVSHATRLASGLIAVADAFGERIALFDSTGRLVRYLGRAGSGPGEFRIPRWVGECAPDTLAVFDAMTSRLTTMDTEGTVIRQRTISPSPLVMDCNRDGTLAYIESLLPQGDSDSPTMLKSEGTILDRAGDQIGSLGKVAAASRAIMGGRAVLAVSDSAVIYGSSEKPTIEFYSFSGSREATRDVGMPRRTPTPANADASIESGLEQIGRSDKDSIIRVMMRQRYPLAKLLPAYRSVSVDEEQNLWVVTSAPGDGFTELRVLPADARPPVTLRFPGEVSVFEVRDGFLIGRASDADLVPRLVVYRAGGEK